MDFGGFDSSTMLISRGGILISIGHFPESLSQAMLVGTMLVGRLGVVVVNPCMVDELFVSARVKCLGCLFVNSS